MKGERRSERTRCSISTWYELGKDRVDQVGRITPAVEVGGQPTEADLLGESLHPGEPRRGDLEATLGALVDRHGRLGGPFGKLRGDAPFAQLGGDHPAVGAAASAALGVRRREGGVVDQAGLAQPVERGGDVPLGEPAPFQPPFQLPPAPRPHRQQPQRGVLGLGHLVTGLGNLVGLAREPDQVR